MSNFPFIDYDWVSASRVRNYMLNDTLTDWLNMYGDNKGFLRDNPELNFTEYIMKKGIEFEEYIVEIIKSKFEKEFVEVSKRAEYPLYKKYRRQYNETLKYMKEGKKIIYQGLLCNHTDNTFGYPDLIVRSDVVNTIFNDKVLSDKKTQKGCSLSPNWHYVVIDIKYTTLKYRADGKTLLNCGSFVPYKAQTLIYNRAIGIMQGLVPGKAYILGRGWRHRDEKCGDPFNRCGRVEFFGKDNEIIEDTDNAIMWCKQLKKEGATWNVYPKPSVEQLYPNMCIQMDYPWGGAKREIAEKIGEITSVWMCGTSCREKCFDQKIYDWRNSEFNVQKLGIPKSAVDTVSRIIKINTSDEKLYDFDRKAAQKSIQSLGDSNLLFVDFETTTGVNNVRCQNPTGVLFMIGVGVVINGEWTFKNYLCDRLDESSENKCVNQFIEFINDINKNGKPCKLIHYSNAEPQYFSRFSHLLPSNTQWVDLLEIIKQCKLVVKGCLDYTLKSVAGKMYKNSLISTGYDDSKVSNGVQAMVVAFLSDERNELLSENLHMKSVVIYNELDCRTMYDILSFISK
jgi:hypothetical protein